MPDARPGHLHWVAWGDDPLARLSALILDHHADALPDLSGIDILLPDPAAARGLRRRLLADAAQAGHAALLGPRITTPAAWLQCHAPPGEGRPPCNPHARLLVLVEALRQYPRLLNAANPWAVADGLINIFDALTLNRIALPEEAADFEARLAAAYGVESLSVSPEGLGHEARMVHTLWQAWQAQLADNGLSDPRQALVTQLEAGIAAAPALPADSLYFAGITPAGHAETAWLAALCAHGAAHLLLQGQPGEAAGYHPDAHNRRLHAALGGGSVPAPPDPSPREAVLDLVFAHHEPALAERARDAARRWPDSPLAETLAVFAAGHHEEEARAIDIQVRRWLLAGHRRIAIVTEDRKLARRVRALLERAGVDLEDSAGWALSTTSAAAALERWLACVEEDFAWLPLMDLLKSPFVGDAAEREARRSAIYRFERDIVHRENIASNLDRYRHGIDARLERLSQFANWTPETATTLRQCFDMLEAAAAPLLALRRRRQAPAADYVAALLASLDGLAMQAELAADAAGEQLLQTLTRLGDAARQWPVQLAWEEFRTWLGQALEAAHFRPAAGAGPVQLLGLGQSALQRFDALVIAGAVAEQLPAPPAATPFFNDRVRQELGLPTRRDHLAAQLHHFRRLLSAAPRVLITACSRGDGEETPLSPWLAALQAFHRLAWGAPLGSDLGPLVANPATLLHRCPDATLPAVPRRPRPALAPTAVPQRLSATGWQQLIDCPYQFYLSRGLGLSAPEEIQLALSKGDYGERVHRCLEALHSDVAGLPGPFTEPFTAASRAAAIAMLEDISAQVFSRDLRDHFEHLGWYRDWLARIPAYIDWQIQWQAGGWAVAGTEAREERVLGPALTLTGRLDRLDRRPGPEGGTQLAILDYKTGQVPTATEVARGEAVQLPFYTLLHGGEETASHVAFVPLGGHDPVRARPALADEDLAALCAADAARLQSVHAQLMAGAPLPAWGDEDTCEHCDMQQICRYTAWPEDDAEDAS